MTQEILVPIAKRDRIHDVLPFSLFLKISPAQETGKGLSHEYVTHRNLKQHYR